MKSVDQALRFLRDLTREPLLAGWALYVFLLPFRLVPSGYPQPVDALAVVLFLLAIQVRRARMDARLLGPFRALVRFTLWVCLVDVAWCIITWEWGVNVLNPFYYIYNAMIFLVALILYQTYGERFLRTTLYALFSVTLLQVVASFVLTFAKTRTSLFFNNSNQLGYYALLTACLTSILSRRLGFGQMKSASVLIACAYLAMLSASRSALIGIGALLALLLFANPRLIVAGIVAAVAFVAVAGSSGMMSKAVEGSERRLTEDRDPNRNFFEDRGYDRIWKNSEYLLSGAGEGHAERFAEAGSTHVAGLEIHSSAGTILFSYGVIGVLLILVFIVRILQGATWRLAAAMVPIFLHSLAHQGLRFSLLWITLAVFVCVKVRPKPHASTALMTSPSRT